LIQRRRDKPGRGGGVGEIPGEADRVEASAAQFADPVVDPGGGDADHHGGAEVGEQPGGGEADAVGAARPVITAARPDRSNAAGMGIARS